MRILSARNWTFALSIAVLGMVMMYNLSRAWRCGKSPACIDLYWSQFWVLSYSDGFERRALLGSVVRSLQGDVVPLTWVALAAAAVALLVVALAALILLRASDGQRYILLIPFLLGPTTMIWAETLGDPMHLCTLLLMLAFLTPGRSGGIAAALTIPVNLLLHEAAAFLLVPVAIAICLNRFDAQVTFARLAVAGAIAAIVSLFFNNQSEAVAMGRLIAPGGEILIPGDNLLPDFLTLIREEIGSYFSSIAGLVTLARNALGAFLWPTTFVLLLSVVLRSFRPLQIFVVLAVISSPLYLIAHDWGRFAIYTLFGTLLLVQGNVWIKPPFRSEVAEGRGGLADYGSLNTALPFVLCAALMAYESHSTYRIAGLTRENIIIVFGVLAAALLLFVRAVPSRDTLDR